MVLSYNAGGGFNWKNVWKFQDPAPLTFDLTATSDALWSAIETEVAALLALMNNGVTLETAEFHDLNSSDVNIKSINSPGSVAGDMLPPQTCLLFMLKSTSGDRSALGRTYLGGWSESNQTGLAGPDGAFRSNVSDALEDIRAAASLSGTPWSVVSFQEEVSRSISAAVAVNQWRTQRRRAY